MSCNLMTCLHIFLPTQLGDGSHRSRMPILLPWTPCTRTGLEKQLIQVSQIGGRTSCGTWFPRMQTGSQEKKGVRGWAFKTLRLVTVDLNLQWAQLASEKHFHHKALFPPCFLKTLPYQFESCRLFLSQKEFPFKQKLFRHFQDMKC